MLTAIGDVMREAYKRGWISTRDGNISLRRGKCLYITPSGVRKNIIHPENIIKIKIYESGELSIPQGVKPSGELEMHRLLQTNICFKSTRAVVHLHPTYTIAAMMAGFDLREIAKMLPELSRYTRVGENVPVLPVTSDVLANCTFMNMLEGNRKISVDIVGQTHHGVCAVGPDPWSVFEHIERLEHACEIVLKSGVKPNGKIEEDY